MHVHVLRSLVKRYTRQTLTDINGPVTVVTGKNRRLTFFEAPNDVNAMLDVAKVADLVRATLLLATPITLLVGPTGAAGLASGRFGTPVPFPLSLAQYVAEAGLHISGTTPTHSRRPTHRCCVLITLATAYTSLLRLHHLTPFRVCRMCPRACVCAACARVHVCVLHVPACMCVC